MLRVVVFASLLVVVTGAADPVIAQDIWQVDGSIQFERLDNPSIKVTDQVNLTDQPKVASYPDLMAIDDALGIASFSYQKDADPFGQFEFDFTNRHAAPIDIEYEITHEIATMNGSDWAMQCWLVVELIDINGFVWLTPDDDPGDALFKGSIQEDATGEWVEVDEMVLGLAANLTQAGTYVFDRGVLVYRDEPARRMKICGDIILSPGDRAIFTGRFELSQDLTPVDILTWGQIKTLFAD